MRTGIVAALVALAGCPSKPMIPSGLDNVLIARSGVRARIEPWPEGNQCSDAPDRVEAAKAVVRHVVAKAMLAEVWIGPPASEIRVCVVDRFPAIACGGRRLAGCATMYTPRAVIVATRWTVTAKSTTLLETYNWRSTLARELVAALALSGSLSIPKPVPIPEAHWNKDGLPEDKWNVDPRVRSLLDSVQAGL